MDAQDALRRVKALLAKAESTTPEEAELLTSKATELMFRYEISMLEVKTDLSTPEGLASITLDFTGTYAIAWRRMVGQLAHALGGHMVYRSHASNRQAVTVYGWESSMPQVEAVIRSLMVQAELALAEWWTDARHYYFDNRRTAARKTYIEGFGVGAASRIRDSLHEASEGTGAELVLVNRKDQLRAEVAEKHNGKLRRGPQPRMQTYDRAAWGRGVDDGRHSAGKSRELTD